MSALAWLIPSALVLGLVGLLAFLWALRSGQFEDPDGAAYRVLDDDGDATGVPVEDGRAGTTEQRAIGVEGSAGATGHGAHAGSGGTSRGN
ncbi:MAG: cbb3-type cytochrome oxidase assembly protein CcoS [Rhizobiales bacterium]|nr:cbb3-type cytochrome oxidase assembly protein CcoS [Hyphomicrobiales bacterium]